MVTDFKQWLEKRGPPRPGLVPKSGNWDKPYRWVRPSQNYEGFSGKLRPELQKKFQEGLRLSTKVLAANKKGEFEQGNIFVLAKEMGMHKDLVHIYEGLEEWQDGGEYLRFVFIRSAFNAVLGKRTDEHKNLERKFFLFREPDATKGEKKRFEKVFDQGEKKANSLIPLMVATQRYLQKKFPDGMVTVYRGIHGESSLGSEIKDALLKDDEIEIPHDGVSSYSLHRRIAKEFATEGQVGFILKKKIPISSVFMAMNAIGTDARDDYRDEDEVLVDSDMTTKFHKDEIQFVRWSN